jgi:periplasmic protein TonB
MFDQLVVSSERPSKTHKSWTVLLSAIGQSVLLGVLILVPLIYTEALPNAMLKTMLVAPSPPPAPAVPQPVAAASRVRVIPLRSIVAPAAIPGRIFTEVGEPPVEYVDVGPAGNTGGNPLTDILQPAAPPPPAAVEQKTQRIRVGGNVEAASIANRVLPQYPAIARTARISGTIVLHAIIAKDGSVQELTYVSGPPLLIKAAMDAVHEWRYRPTLLNGEPVEVETTIDVTFNLGG